MLNVSQTSIGGALESLAGLKKLTILRIIGCNNTTGARKQLAGLTSLQNFEYEGSGIEATPDTGANDAKSDQVPVTPKSPFTPKSRVKSKRSAPPHCAIETFLVHGDGSHLETALRGLTKSVDTIDILLFITLNADADKVLRACNVVFRTSATRPQVFMAEAWGIIGYDRVL